MKNMFLNEKKALAMIHLLNGPTYIRHIAEKCNTMYPHALQTLKLLEEREYVGSSKEGRIRIYELTKKGQKVAQLLKEIWDLTTEQEQ